MKLKQAKDVFEAVLDLAELHEWNESLLNLFFTPNVTECFIYMKKRFGDNFIVMEEFRSKDIDECIVYWINVFTKSIKLIEEFI